MTSIPTALKLYLLGAFRLTRNDEEITQFDADSARALLAYLVLHADQAHQRVVLADLFWADQPVENALHNLRSALNRLRKALQDDDNAAQPLLLVTRQTLQWNPRRAIWVDVLEFQELLSAAKRHGHRRLAGCPWCIQRLTRVARLYRGEFLAGLRVESLPFDEWRQIEQEQLHRLAMQSFHVLGEYYQASGAYSEAEHYARRQLALERWNEEAHQQLIHALCASGQRSAALAQYEACRGILAAEFGVAPAPATTAFYEELRGQRQTRRRSAMLTFDQDAGVCATRRKEFPNNLPLPVNAFIDRQAELDTLLHRLVTPAHRLTTLSGAGGIGKTRLALTTALTLVRSFANGVWFVPLAELPSTTDSQQARSLILQQLAQIFKLAPDLQGVPAGDLMQQVIDYLRNKELLLVLDSFEHLLAAAPLLPKVLQHAPNVTLLVTSRQPLGLLAEQVLHVPDLGASAAVQLFIERVRASYPSFAESVEQRRCVEEICTYLHGSPLAIELAASAVRHQSLAAICALVKRELTELATTHPDVPERHRSLRALFQHSWQLLAPGEQRLLVGMLHRGGNGESATAQRSSDLPTRLLADLHEKSVLVRDAAGGYQVSALLHPFVHALALHADITRAL